MLSEQAGEPAHLLAAVCELAAATGVNGMVGGQYIDVRGLVDGGAASLRRLHELKTGRLIGASVECVLLPVRRAGRPLHSLTSEASRPSSGSSSRSSTTSST